ncbi:transposase, partial [Acinetobacter pittii]|uniref:transposase n=1 Tax=Acinetobacter pittii TaxID=48296 RepID=UPI003312FEB6
MCVYVAFTFIVLYGFVQSLIKLCGLNWTAPDYSTLCRRQKHIDIAISYQKSSDGLHLLVDSTG